MSGATVPTSLRLGEQAESIQREIDGADHRGGEALVEVAEDAWDSAFG
jgi:hypothetical protein